MPCVKRTFIVLAGLVLMLAALPAAAVDRHKAANALAAQAASAYERGDMGKAATLYLRAFQLASDQPAYLYGAARAEQSAGDIEHAAAHYQQFAALPGAEPARVAKAKAFLSDLAVARAEAKASEAERALAAGDPALACGLWKQADGLARGQGAYLFKAGVAAQDAKMPETAVDLFRAYLRVAPLDAVERASAENRLRTLAPPIAAPAQPVETKAPATKPEPMAPQPVVVRADPIAIAPLLPPPPPKAQRSLALRIAPWATAALGLAGLGLGVGWNLDYNQRDPLLRPQAEKTAAIAAYGAGGVLLTAGVVWGLWQVLGSD